MSMSSRKRRQGRAKKAAWLSLLFVNLVAPLVLLVLDKALPEGLFGRKGPPAPQQIQAAAKQVLPGVPPQKGLAVPPLAKPVQTGGKPVRHDVHFSNKGSGNDINNIQVGQGSGQSTGFSNEGNNNRINNEQRVK